MPVQKAFSPAPVRITARTSSFLRNDCQSSRISACIRWSNALCTSGRLRVTTATPSSSSYSSVSYVSNSRPPIPTRQTPRRHISGTRFGGPRGWSARRREVVHDGDPAVVEAQEVPQRRRLGKRILVAPRDVVEDDVPEARRPVRGGALVRAVGLGRTRLQQVHAYEARVDIEPGFQRGLVDDQRVRRVDQRGAGGLDPEPPPGVQGVDTVVGVARVAEDLLV